MRRRLEYLDTVRDNQQKKKVRHKIGDIIALVFFAMLANANEWVAIERFGSEHEEFCDDIWNWQTVYHAIDGKAQCGKGDKTKRQALL